MIQLIRANDLPREYGSRLHVYVRAKFDELWLVAQTPHDED